MTARAKDFKASARLDKSITELIEVTLIVVICPTTTALTEKT